VGEREQATAYPGVVCWQASRTAYLKLEAAIDAIQFAML
jgi:hypothetical protein